jgi:hypothetical protein
MFHARLSACFLWVFCGCLFDNGILMFLLVNFFVCRKDRKYWKFFMHVTAELAVSHSNDYCPVPLFWEQFLCDSVSILSQYRIFCILSQLFQINLSLTFVNVSISLLVNSLILGFKKFKCCQVLKKFLYFIDWYRQECFTHY